MPNYLLVQGGNRVARFYKAREIFGEFSKFRENLQRSQAIFTDACVPQTDTFGQLHNKVTATVDIQPQHAQLCEEQKEILLGDCTRLFGSMPMTSHYNTAGFFASESVFSGGATTALAKASKSEEANLLFLIPSVIFFLSELAAQGKLPESSVAYNPNAKYAYMFVCRDNANLDAIKLKAKEFLNAHGVAHSELDNSENIIVDLKGLILAVDREFAIGISQLPKLKQFADSKKTQEKPRVAL